MKIHIVKPGDTLYKLSQTYNISLEKLIAANPQIVNPDQIDVGMKVKIPLKATEPMFQNQNPQPHANIQQPIIVKPKPVENVIKPSELPSKPVENVVKPAEVPPKPVENVVKPAEVPPKPVENVVKPAEVPPKPVENIVKPAELPPKSAQTGLKSQGYYEHPFEQTPQVMGNMKESINYTPYAPYPPIEKDGNLFAQYNIPAVEAYSNANYNTPVSSSFCDKTGIPMQPNLYPYNDFFYYNPYDTHLTAQPYGSSEPDAYLMSHPYGYPVTDPDLMSHLYGSPMPDPNLAVYPYPFSEMNFQRQMPPYNPIRTDSFGLPHAGGYAYPSALGSANPELPADNEHRETAAVGEMGKESVADEPASANNLPKKKPVKHMGAQEALQRAANRMSRNQSKRRVKQENLPWMTI